MTLPRTSSPCSKSGNTRDVLLCVTGRPIDQRVLWRIFPLVVLRRPPCPCHCGQGCDITPSCRTHIEDLTFWTRLKSFITDPNSPDDSRAVVCTGVPQPHPTLDRAGCQSYPHAIELQSPFTMKYFYIILVAFEKLSLRRVASVSEVAVEPMILSISSIVLGSTVPHSFQSCSFPCSVNFCITTYSVMLKNWGLGMDAVLACWTEGIRTVHWRKDELGNGRGASRSCITLTPAPGRRAERGHFWRNRG